GSVEGVRCCQRNNKLKSTIERKKPFKMPKVRERDVCSRTPTQERAGPGGIESKVLDHSRSPIPGISAGRILARIRCPLCRHGAEGKELFCEPKRSLSCAISTSNSSSKESSRR